MEKFIEDYVLSCPECQQNKAARHARYSLLQALESAYRTWDSISMDFIIELPVSDGCLSVWVIIDRFMKMAHFIPLKDGEKKATDLVKIFLKEVWRFHGLPSSIVSDRDSRFTSAFWSSLVKALDIRLKMSSPFHPQMDGQTEKVNQTLECYLRNYCNYEQDNWSKMLPLAENAYNNSLTTAMGMSPFFANFGFDRRTNWPIEAEAMNAASRNYVHWMTSVYALCRKGLEQAWETMGKYHDRHAKKPPKYSVGDLVMLNGKILKI
jgi:transposase InsO family protein